MNTILCRADGNSSTGLGHLYRMFALYEMFRKDFKVVFITKSDTTLEVIPESYTVSIIPESVSLSEEPEWLSNTFDNNTSIVIADGYHFTSAYQKKIKEKGFQLAYVDDLASEKMYADIVINHGPHIKPKDYSVAENTLFALGTKYAILRREFLTRAKENRTITHLDTAFICFGGADQFDLSYKAAQALLHFDQIKTIHVVLGGAYVHKPIFELAEQNNRVTIHRNLDAKTLAMVMQSCNIAIAPCSTILYELCCVKMPILSGYYVDNQKLIYKGLKETGVIFPVGDMASFKAKDFKNHLNTILQLTSYDSYIKSQSVLFDHKIKNRFINLITPVTFRNATIDDAKLLFDWANDETVRANSYQSEKIDFESHCNWLENKLESSNHLFLIAQIQNEDAGLIRYTIQKDHTVVGISIAKPYRGKGLAPKMLLESAKDYFKTNTLPIFAYIKETNAPSIKSFEKAGYSFLKREVVSGHQSSVYQLKES